MILFHANRARRAPFDAQTTLDPPGFLFEDDRGQVTLFSFLHRDSVEGLDEFRIFLVPFDLIKPCHPETGFWADIDTSATENAFGSIEDGKEVTLEASYGLSDGHLF